MQNEYSRDNDYRIPDIKTCLSCGEDYKGDNKDSNGHNVCPVCVKLTIHYKRILDVICKYFDIKHEILKSKIKFDSINIARKIYCYLAVKYSTTSKNSEYFPNNKYIKEICLSIKRDRNTIRHHFEDVASQLRLENEGKLKDKIMTKEIFKIEEFLIYSHEYKYETDLNKLYQIRNNFHKEIRQINRQIKKLKQLTCN